MEEMTVNLDSVKHLQGYSVVMKTILHTQIQQLVEQLASYTDEEVVCLAVNFDNCTFTNIGSSVGKTFLQNNGDIKKRFLQYGLNKKLEKSQLPNHDIGKDQSPVPITLTKISKRRCTSASPKTKKIPPVKKNKKSKSHVVHGVSNNDISSESTENCLESLIAGLDDGENNVDIMESYNTPNIDNTPVRNNDKAHSIVAHTDCEASRFGDNTEWLKQDTNKASISLDPNIIIKIENVEGDQDYTPGYTYISNQNFVGEIERNKDENATDRTFDQTSTNGSIIESPQSAKNSLHVRARVIERRISPITLRAKIGKAQTKCPYCSRNYANYANLKRHIRRHEGIYPYKCEACQKRFSDRTMYKRHVFNTNLSCSKYYCPNVEIVNKTENSL